ncbi:MAG: hypothetical protein K2K87_08230, partial [Lachnospiraceae bacterium]|nr:hypothetical protein [Lachnospiraceae bacterium]
KTQTVPCHDQLLFSKILLEQSDYIIVSGARQCETSVCANKAWVSSKRLALKCNLCYNQAKAYILWRICLGVPIPATPIHIKRHQAVS